LQSVLAAGVKAQILRNVKQLLLSVVCWRMGLGSWSLMQQTRPGAVQSLGAMLSREKALSSPISKEAFGIVDRIIEDDARVKEFIEQYGRGAI
jgi:hypothetical protein